MTTLNISLPDTLGDFVQERVTQGDYDTASDYLRELIHEDQRRKAQEKLDALLREGLESGLSTPMTAQDWDEMRRDLLRQDIAVAVEAEERGEVAPLDIEAIIAQGKRHLMRSSGIKGPAEPV